MESNPIFSGNGNKPVAPSLRVYIATKFENKAGFRKVKKLIEAAGHTVTHDWTKDDAEGLTGADRAEFLQACAMGDLRGVYSCDVLVLLARPKMAGAFVELGMAIGMLKPVIILDATKKGNSDCIFYHLPSCGMFQHLKDTDALMRVLSYGCTGGLHTPVPKQAEAPHEERPDFTPGRN